MKHLIFTVFVLLLALPQLQGQNQFFKVVKGYFRVDPFAGRFSNFVEAVKTDPELKEVQVIPKTDTSLFSVKADYKTFNPFTIKARRVEMTLAERGMAISSAAPEKSDTLMLYMIAGFFDSTRQTLKMVQKEYKKINAKIKKDLPINSTQSLTALSGIRDGQLTNHAVINTMIAPISTAWYLTNTNELVLMVILRMKYKNNMAYPSGRLMDYFSFKQSY